MAPDETTPKIHIDSDWKAQAQAEKQRLAAEEKKSAAAPPGRHGQLPAADFRSLMGTVASQAIMGLGALADQTTGRIVVDLESAKFGIDLLDVLLEKTTGNLSDAETKELNQLLAELRARYVQIAQMITRQETQKRKNAETPK